MSTEVIDTVRAVAEKSSCRPTITVDAPGVVVEIVDATTCSALGCREQDGLVRATIDGFGARVVCPDHLEQLLEREVDA